MGPKRVKPKNVAAVEGSKARKSDIFSEDERRILLQFVKENKEKLLSKTNDHFTIEGKKELWGELAQQFSAEGTVRTVPVLKQKWNNMQRDAKADFKKQTKPPTGGGKKFPIRWESEFIIREIGIDEPVDTEGIEGGIDTGDPEAAIQVKQLE
jgi:hypothetical protein